MTPINLTLEEYIERLVALYWMANNADQPDAKPWQKPEHVASHCRRIEDMIQDVVGYAAWNRFMQTYEIASLLEEVNTND